MPASQDGFLKCAFCKEEAVTGEHLWDDWLNGELPKKTRFNAKKRLSLDAAPIEYVSVGLNEKLPVVCEDCNSGWMCDLTAKMKDRFSETILKNKGLSLGPSRNEAGFGENFAREARESYGRGLFGAHPAGLGWGAGFREVLCIHCVDMHCVVDLHDGVADGEDGDSVPSVAGFE
jgi:hypothetical protein